MSNGPIVRSSGSSGSALQVAGVVLILQAGLRAVVLASFLYAISADPRFGRIIFDHAYPLTMSVLLPAAFAVAGVVAGLMLLARARAAAAVARAFCAIGLLSLGFGIFQMAHMPAFHAHPLPTRTYVLMALNGAIYVGTLIAASRSA